MTTVRTNGWDRLERWSPRLFVLAAVFVLVGAANSGLAFLSDGYSFDVWGGIVLELGRLAALLGTAGVTVRIAERNARVGNPARAVAALAVVAIAGLLALATLEAVGILTDPIGIFGLVAYALSVGAFLSGGVGVLWTGAHSRRVGTLLLVTVAALLVVFFGRLVVPLGLVATVVPGLQALVYFGIGYDLRGRSVTARQTAAATDTSP